MATEAIETQTSATDAGAEATEATKNKAVEKTEAVAPSDAETKTEIKAVEGPWGDDWRQKIAGDDAKFLKRLDRFQSPNDLAKSYRALEQKMATGDLKPSLGDNPTDDEVAAYRKNNGIPDAAEGYLENMPDGLVVGDADKPIVENFIKDMHAKNMPPEAVHGAMKWYYSEIEERRAALGEEDKRSGQATDDELRGEWGGDYRANMNAANSLLDAAPGDLADELRGARLANGSPLITNADALRWLSNMATEINPAGTVVPGGGAQQIESLEGRKNELEALMRSDRPAYNKRRGEYTQVLQALDKVKARAA